MTWARTWQRSISDPDQFWSEAARLIDWNEPWQTVIDRDAVPLARWFSGGHLNTCFNAVDRHVINGHGQRIALIYDSPLTNTTTTYTFADLQSSVARLAGLLRAHRVRCGDRVVIYMPMIPEAVFAMLACARIGAVHSVVFGGFASHELAKRIDDCRPTLILTSSCGIEPSRVVPYKALLDAALEMSQHPTCPVLLFQRPEHHAQLRPGLDLDWNEELQRASAVDCVPVEASHPLYILYTSGTTGIPKGVVRDNGGHAVALTWSMAFVYGIQPGEIFFAASDIGWVVGHSYVVYGPLLRGCGTVLYEGKPVGTPDAGAYWRVVRQHGVDVLFTAPTALRAIRREDPHGLAISAQGIGRLRTLFLAGERADPASVHWAEQRLGIPVIDHWWQTELGWPAIATCIGLGEQRVRHGSAGKPVPGYRVAVLGNAHSELPAGCSGELALKLPLPPGCLTGLWNNENGLVHTYLTTHPGWYRTGDTAHIDEDGYIQVMGRVDDIINVAGHRLSTGAIEQIIAAHPDVVECAVIGANDDIKGMVPIAILVLKNTTHRAHAAVVAEAIEKVRAELGPIAAFRSAAVVERLPKTRSGKVLRATIRELANGGSPGIPPTIEDPATIETIREALRSIGYAREG